MGLGRVILGVVKVLGAEDVDTCSEMFVSAGSRGVGIFA